MTIFQYNLVELLQAYVKNKDEISSYIKKRSSSDIVEHYYSDNSDDSKKILGMSITIFVVILVINLAIFAWSIYALVVYWSYIPDYVKVIGIIGLFTFPILTLVLVYATNNKL